jgi:surface antigen
LDTLFISDFRGKQLQQYKNSGNYTFITEDTAEYSWFNNSVLTQLPLYSLDKANIVIALGFNDCVYSCVWEASYIFDKIIANYVNTINKLIKDYPSFTFYVCSVNPIDADYPFSAYHKGVIPLDTLNTKIKRFNAKLREMCTATFIDCYSYLSSTSFATRDGVRYTPDTCKNLLSYIASSIETGGTAFVPRFSKPVVDDTDIESDLYWLGDSYVIGDSYGLNPFDNLGQVNASCPGDTLPNSTAYAWGRFYEILGTKPTLSTGKVEQWYTNTSDGYKRGKEPALGAIMCWEGKNASASTDGKGGYGHVAIVEQINADGSVLVSESFFNSSVYWRTLRRSKGTDGNWGQNSAAYKFQGFIYCPVTASVTKDELFTQNKYINKGSLRHKSGAKSLHKSTILLTETRLDYVYTPSTDIDAKLKPNAKYIWQYLSQRGWTLNAVAALLGNLHVESGTSPGIWESTISGSIVNSDGTQSLNMTAINAYYSRKGRYPGYGLVQWTPYSKYTDWCASNGLPYWDMDSQLQRIEWEAKNKKQWGIARYNKNYSYNGEKFYGLSFSDFITSTKDAGWLAAAFAFCYEKPGSSSESAKSKLALCIARDLYATYWYDFLKDLPSITVDKKLQVDPFYISQSTSTTAKVCGIVRNAKRASYTLNKGTAKAVKINGSLATISLSGLVPNKKYTLTVDIIGNDNEKISKQVSFTTPQDLPESVSKIAIYPVDSKMPHNTFQLTTSPRNPDFGYWKNNGYGYIVQLIINGKVKREKIVNSLQTNFSISDYFGYTDVKLGDTVQIGIRTWILYEGKRLYDTDFAKCSNPVCMLSKQVTAYLTKT